MDKKIVSTTLKIYEPQFDEDEDCYKDTNPYKKYERSIISYECKCRAGACFTNSSQYKQHIKTKTHKKFIDNYKLFHKQLNDLQKEIKERDIQIEMLKRKVQKLSNYIKEFEEDDDNIFKDCI